jgi:hypothetical protein
MHFFLCWLCKALSIYLMKEEKHLLVIRINYYVFHSFVWSEKICHTKVHIVISWTAFFCFYFLAFKQQAFISLVLELERLASPKSGWRHSGALVRALFQVVHGQRLAGYSRSWSGRQQSGLRYQDSVLCHISKYLVVYRKFRSCLFSFMDCFKAIWSIQQACFIFITHSCDQVQSKKIIFKYQKKFQNHFKFLSAAQLTQGL